MPRAHAAQWLIAISATLTSLHAACPRSLEGQHPSEPDSVVINTAAAAARAQPAMQQIWPGFWSPPKFAIYRRDTAVYLYSSTGAPPSFKPVLAAALPSELQGRFFVHNGAWPGLRGGVLPIDPNARQLAMAVNVADRPASLLEFLLHESFHGWQLREFANFFSDVPHALPDTLQLPVSYRASLQNERHLLISAVKSNNTDSSRFYVRRYLVTRQARLGAAPALARMVERRQERLEGTAEFVGLAGRLSGGVGAATALQDSVAARLLTDWRWGEASTPVTRQLRWRVYVSGAAMAFLLQQLQCNGWQASVQAGSYLDDLLKSCVLASSGKSSLQGSADRSSRH